MTYADLFGSQEALRSLCKIRVTKVAIKAARMLEQVTDHLNRLRTIAREQAEGDRKAIVALMQGMVENEVEDWEGFGNPVDWAEVPEDSLTGLEILQLEELGALINAPGGERSSHE